MDSEALLVLDRLKQKLKSASVAQIGGFRPPDDPISSWFGKAVCLPNESLPVWNGKTMFPLLQIRLSELPFIPDTLRGIELLVLYHNQDRHPFDMPHGEGWLIREYRSINDLVPIPTLETHPQVKPFPIKWSLITDDAPGWEQAWDIIDLEAVNQDQEASDYFFSRFNRYSSTKVGGYPFEIQHGVEGEHFVFQVGSEEKPNWMWADNGIGYFFKSPSGEWSWSCQFY